MGRIYPKWQQAVILGQDILGNFYFWEKNTYFVLLNYLQVRGNQQRVQ